MIQVPASAEEETRAVAAWLAARKTDGLLPHEIGVFVRSAAEVDRARAAVEAARRPYKGLEFRAVEVMACEDEVIPSHASGRLKPALQV